MACCPQCNNQLKRVCQSENSMLNREQFDAVKAGDWYCETCTADNGQSARTNYKYWWDKQVIQ